MIKPKCRRCGMELQEYGALLFSPPLAEPKLLCDVVKSHLCPMCYTKVESFIDNPMDWFN